MMGLALGLAPLLGPTCCALVALFSAFLLVSDSPLVALAGVMSITTSAVSCSLLGHYIGVTAGSAYSSSYAKVGAFLGLGFVVCDPQVLDALVRQIAATPQPLSWQVSGWIGARLTVCVCKVSLALSMVVLLIEMPLQMLGPRGKSEIIRTTAALRPILVLGVLGMTAGYVLSMISDVYLPLTK